MDESQRNSNAGRSAGAIPRILRALSLHAIRRFRRAQDHLLHALGSRGGDRPTLVAAMLARSSNDATSYWLQLVVSVGIATLGLVVGSAAVIIGAMLVAPLMGPIIALAMGLAAGSPLLVLRSLSRIALSVLLAVGGAALITVSLPFHELNAELAGRASPTVLDLATAGFCALAGVYATLRPGSDTAATAAGTSIGISLVPPLCASGYGAGTHLWAVGGGAALLFLTNLVAIIVVGTVSFVCAGFNRVDATALERDELAKLSPARISAAVARSLADAFESKAGPLLRFLMPLVLLALVYVPLRQALDEVAWEVRARATVQQALGREPGKVVQSRIRVERGEIDLAVVLLGKTADAEAARTRLHSEIAAGAGVAPRVEVYAVPDSSELAGLESSLRAAREPLALPAPAPPQPQEQVSAAASLVREALGRHWPLASAGEPLSIDMGAEQGAALRVRVAHLGRALGPDAVEMLRGSLGAELGREVLFVDAALDSAPITREAGDAEFIARVAAALQASRTIGGLAVCVTRPEAPPRGRAAAQAEALATAVDRLLAQAPLVMSSPGQDWSVRIAKGTCPSEQAADGGTRELGAAGAPAR